MELLPIAALALGCALFIALIFYLIARLNDYTEYDDE